MELARWARDLEQGEERDAAAEVAAWAAEPGAAARAALGLRREATAFARVAGPQLPTSGACPATRRSAPSAASR
jgi:hypothetical protein